MERGIRRSCINQVKLWPLVLATVLTCVHLPSYGANLDIQVFQKGNAEPVADANVVIMHTENYTVTNSQGRSRLEAVELPAQLKIIAVGYEPQVIPIDTKKKKISIYLTPLLVEAESLQVVADRLPEKTSKMTFGAATLTKAPGTQGDPLRIIESLPGIVSSGEDSGDVYMRGSGSRDNIVLIDDVPVSYLYHFGGLRSVINPNLVKDMNVFLGGFPVEYGDAMGGAVDVRLRAPKRDRYHVDLGIGTYESNLLLEGPIGGPNSNTAFFIAGRRSYLDYAFSAEDFNRVVRDEDEDPAQQDRFITVPVFFDAQAAVHHRLPQGDINAYYFTAKDKLAFENREDALRDPQLAGDLNMETRFQTTGIRWQQIVFDSVRFSLPLSVLKEVQKLTLGQDATGNPFYADITAYTWHAQPQWQWQRGQSQFSIGYSYDRYRLPLRLNISALQDEEDTDFDFTTAPKYQVNTTMNAHLNAPYIKQRHDWGNGLTTDIGLRYTRGKASNGVAIEGSSPRAAAELAVSEVTTVLASWGKYMQIPEGHKLVEGFGNPGLGFIESEHRILGIEQKLNSLWQAKLEAYHKPMEKLVVAVDDQEPPANYRNSGEGQAYGADLYIYRKRHNRRMGWMSYSYSRSQRKDLITGQSRRFSGEQPNTLTLVWGQAFPGSNNKWDWSFRFQVHDGKPYTPVTGRVRENPDDETSRWRPVYGATNSKRMPTYYRLDLRFDRRFFFNNWEMSAYVDLQNATNHYNVIDYDYGREYENTNNPREVTGIGNFVTFGFQAKF